MSVPNFPGPPASKRGARPGLLPDLAIALAVLAGVAVLLYFVSKATRPLPLEPGLAIEREIGEGETHRYAARLAKGEVLHVEIDQGGDERGLDVVVRLLDPQGRVVALADCLNGGLWHEELALVAERPGAYLLQVKQGIHHGPYRLEVKAVGRRARPEDSARAEALRLHQEAANLTLEADSRPRQIELRQQALGLWNRLGDRRKEAEELYQIGTVYASLGQPERATGFFHRSVQRWAELGNREEQARGLKELGRVQRKAGQLEEALAVFEEGLHVAAEGGDEHTRAHLLYYRGSLFTDLGDPGRAIQELKKSLELGRKLQDPVLEATVLHELGYSYRHSGSWEQAILRLEEALEVAQAGQVTITEAAAHNSLGGLYQALGEWDRAIEHFEAALELNRAARDIPQESKTLNNLALVHQKRGDFEQALKLYGKSLSLHEGMSRSTRASVLNNMAFLHLELNRPRRALSYCQRALELAGSQDGTTAAALESQGIAYLELGDLDAARRSLETALALDRQRRDRPREANALIELSRLARATGDLDRALVHAEQAVEIIESLRTRVANEDLRSSFLASKRESYEFYIDTLMALDLERPTAGYDAEALRVNERARARSLLDLLDNAASQEGRNTDPALAQRLRRLRFRVSQLAEESQRLEDSGTASPEAIAAAAHQLETAETAYAKAQAELRSQQLGPGNRTQVRTLSAAEIQSQILGKGTLLLEYTLGQERSYLWVVTPSSIQSFPLPPRAAIEAKAGAFYKEVTARNRKLPGLTEDQKQREYEKADERAARAADELSRLLLEPAAELLEGQGRTVLVVSDGALQNIPFAALLLTDASGQRLPLMLRHQIVHLPSVSVLAAQRRELGRRSRPAKTLAVIADPVFDVDDPRLPRTSTGAGRDQPVLGQVRSGTAQQASLRSATAAPLTGSKRYARLRWSKREAEQILSLVPSPAQKLEALGFDASLDTVVRGRLDQYRIVHFATHGELDSDHPERSALVLSRVNRQGQRQEGTLTLLDVYNLRLNADLVTLSACETGRGKEIRGEGLIGLTRGFLLAGSRRVLASLWSVDDRTTSKLMPRFYHYMLKEGKSPAVALRQAQIEMWNSPLKSPYYWAGFSLQGEWQ